MDEVAEFFRGEVEEPGVGLVCSPLGHSGSNFWLPGSAGDYILVKVDSTVRELAEGSLLLELCSSYCQPTLHLWYPYASSVFEFTAVSIISNCIGQCSRGLYGIFFFGVRIRLRVECANVPAASSAFCESVSTESNASIEEYSRIPDRPWLVLS